MGWRSRVSTIPVMSDHTVLTGPTLGTAAPTLTTEAFGGLPPTDDLLTAVSVRRADWIAACEGGRRSLDIHRTPPPAPGIDGAKDVNSDRGLW